jgi:hypothetical protein
MLLTQLKWILLCWVKIMQQINMQELFLNFVCRYSVWTEQSPFMAWLLCDDDGAGISL